jgi:3-hydroxyisobutyrate dehydrogenase-like beta-hydroxyacid dehydrogenase
MGVPLAGFILKAGYRVTVFSRSPASRSKLVTQGAQEADSVAQCARRADIVFSSIPDDDALREVALGPGGVLANARPDAIFVDTSTVSAESSAEVDEEAKRSGVAYLRAPVSGNAASARSGDVTVLVSGPQAAWETVKPVLAACSKSQLYLGAGENARYAKLVINALVVNTAQALAEALALGRGAGLGWDAMLDAIAASTIASPWLKVKSGLLKQRDFTPTMTTRLILKDLDLMLTAARANGVSMPLTALTRQMMQAAVGAGFGQQDYLAVVKLAEQNAGLSSDDVE